jgi:hypothetical protein
MHLSAEQVERFYRIWWPLILFVNRRRKLVPGMRSADFTGPWDRQKVRIIRDALWADDSLREAFLAENPAGLSQKDLALVDSWKDRKEGKFFILRHLKKYTVLLDGEDQTIYGVLGLTDSLDQVVPFVPCYVEAVLLPFEGRIVYDSLLVPYNIDFGKGYRDSFERTYKDAKERGAIVTSLGPPATPASPKEQREAARTTNARVLEAFKAHLYASGLSSKVAERDLGNVGELAEKYLLDRPEPRSLRVFGAKEVTSYLARLSGAGGPAAAKGRQAVTSLKRFVRFLRDTQRIDYDAAQEALEALKGSG